MKTKRIRCSKCLVVTEMTFKRNKEIEHDIHWEAECPDCGKVQMLTCNFPYRGNA
jgi:hypothetical protein